MPVTTKRYTYLRNMVGGVSLRVAQLDGVEYTVYPCVGILGDIVVHPMNAPGPELVLSSELASSAQSWNYRPIIPDHPLDEDGKPISALTPEIIESQAYGILFNSKFEDDKLQFELYVNEVKGLALGGEPARVVECLRKGEMVEVSIGAYIDVEPNIGDLNGAPYVGIWHNLTPDHLAAGLMGAKGACSVEMGAGAPRANSQGGQKVMRAAEAEVKSVTRWCAHRLLRSLATNNDVERALDDLLWDTVSNYDWRVDVDQPGKIVYYRMWGNESGVWSRTYNVDSNGIPLSLNDDEQAVVKTTTFVPVTVTNSRTNTVITQGEEMAKPTGEVVALATSLIASEESPWVETHRDTLEALEVDSLTEMLEMYTKEKETGNEPSEPAVVPTEPVVPIEPIAAGSVTITQKELAGFQASAKYVQDLTVKHRKGLVASIESVDTNRLTTAQLEAMGTDVLEAMVPKAVASVPVANIPSMMPTIPRFVEAQETPSVPNGITAAIGQDKKDVN